MGQTETIVIETKAENPRLISQPSDSLPGDTLRYLLRDAGTLPQGTQYRPVYGGTPARHHERGVYSQTIEIARPNGRTTGRRVEIVWVRPGKSR